MKSEMKENAYGHYHINQWRQQRPELDLYLGARECVPHIGGLWDHKGLLRVVRGVRLGT